VLYPLYALCEIAIISTDLAELLGSAIGLTLLFPKLPLWSAVLLTGVDVFIFLIIGDPSRTGRPVRLFEIVIILLVCAKTVSKHSSANWKFRLQWFSFVLLYYSSGSAQTGNKSFWALCLQLAFFRLSQTQYMQV
jgi:Mn2+/Fe2+ NRAMP family transporter